MIFQFVAECRFKNVNLGVLPSTESITNGGQMMLTSLRLMYVITTIMIIGMLQYPREASGASRTKRIDEPRPLDVWGHTYKRQTNLFRDSDRNGVINLYQQQDLKPKAPRGKVSRPKRHRR